MGEAPGAPVPREGEIVMATNEIIDDDEPIFVISVAARIVGVRTQTLRYYERLGLIEPSRTGGNQRVYSRRDVEKVRRVRSLIDDLGVNLAGAEVVVKLLEQLEDSHQKIESLESEVERLRELAGANAHRSASRT